MNFYCIALIIALVVPNALGGLVIWPLPSQQIIEGEPLALSSDFKITTSSKSQYIKNTIERYSKFIQQGKNSNGLSSVNVICDNDSQDLNEFTLTNYTIRINSKEAVIHSSTPFGAIYGIESFSQLARNGSLVGSSIEVYDESEYLHRGVMIDTGRRYWPVETIKKTIDGMLYSKLNVLHWHLTDYCRASFESETYPILTSKLTGMHEGSYNHSTVKEIIEYAKERCVRIIPEVDIPGHSLGFSALSEVGMQFCNNDNVQMYADPENKTLNILTNYLQELVDIFPEPYFHIGADEVNVKGRCDSDSFKRLEEQVFEFLHSKGKRPVGWEEILYGTKSAKPYCVINGWKNHQATKINREGYDAIESREAKFYLDHTDYNNFWLNIKGFEKSPSLRRNENGRFFGGEVSMWTDSFLYKNQCGAASGREPVGHELYDRKNDKAFDESILSIIYPRSITAAGSFWRFDQSYDEYSEEFKENIKYQNEKLNARGVTSCPSDCKCDEVSKCGKKYL